MNMREKIARAIVAAIRENNEAPFIEDSELEYATIDAIQLDLLLVADAVLEAMREPDNDFLAAGYKAMFVGKWDGSQAPMMAEGWRAMIDAARQ